MHLRFTLPLFISLLTLGSYAKAQEATPAKAEQASAKEISIGSHVLKQVGESEYSYKNEPYTYNKIWEVPNTTRAVLYERTRKWLQNVSGATVSNIIEDAADNSSLTATLQMPIPSVRMKEQYVTFHFKFSFKDNKIRLQADAFNFYCRWDNGLQHRQVYVGKYLTNEEYYDSGEYNKEFHDLKPLLKKQMRDIYETFDERYLKIVRSMKASVLENSDNNW